MFIGQQHIIKEVTSLIDSKSNYNLLLLGNPGQGKTMLGLKIANFLGKQFLYKIADDNPLFFGRVFEEAEYCRTLFIDEIHRLDINVERLYPIIDRGENFLIFATNQPQILPEAFRTRCVELLFARYSREELRQVAQQYIGTPLNNELLDILVDISEENPRRIKQFSTRLLSILQMRGNFNLTREELLEISQSYFNIIGGLNSLEREYLEFLSRVGNASLQTLSSALGIKKDVLQAEVEPALLYKELIKISSRGREYIYE